MRWSSTAANKPVWSWEDTKRVQTSTTSWSWSNIRGVMTPRHPRVGAPLRVRGYRHPSRMAGEVRITDRACGVCHSDLTCAGSSKEFPDALRAGHESLERSDLPAPGVSGIQGAATIGGAQLHHALRRLSALPRRADNLCEPTSRSTG